jgi:hypothetical protein
MFALPAILAAIQLLLIKKAGFEHESVVFAVLDRQANISELLKKIYAADDECCAKIKEYIYETNSAAGEGAKS